MFRHIKQIGKARKAMNLRKPASSECREEIDVRKADLLRGCSVHHALVDRRIAGNRPIT